MNQFLDFGFALETPNCRWFFSQTEILHYDIRYRANYNYDCTRSRGSTSLFPLWKQNHDKSSFYPGSSKQKCRKRKALAQKGISWTNVCIISIILDNLKEKRKRMQFVVFWDLFQSHFEINWESERSDIFSSNLFSFLWHELPQQDSYCLQLVSLFYVFNNELQKLKYQSKYCSACLSTSYMKMQVAACNGSSLNP